MLNRSASLTMSTSILKALPGKLDIKRHSHSIIYIFNKFLPAKFLLDLFFFQAVLTSMPLLKERDL